MGRIIYLFGSQPEDERQEKLVAHAQETYLSWLHGRGTLSSVELRELRSALEPLKARFPVLTTVETVRNSMHTKTVDGLSREEKALWAVKNVFPWFDIAGATEMFLVSQEEADRSVLFFRDEYRRKIHRFVSPRLAEAEVYFWILLQMYRLQAEMR
jgi:hypothetical protein